MVLGVRFLQWLQLRWCSSIESLRSRWERERVVEPQAETDGAESGGFWSPKSAL